MPILAMETEEYEEWMLESIRQYKDLHDFELQSPTRVIEWIGDQSICVAGYESDQTNEILQLLLPQKLHTKETQSLCPERDLKVEHGGFSEYPVYSLKHIPESSLLVTTGPGDSSVRVWQIGADDKDVIKAMSIIQSDDGKETWTKMATTSSTAPRIIHGSKVNGVQLTEIESSRQVYSLGGTCSDPVSCLSFLDSNTFFLCCSSGRQYIADIRKPQPASAGSLDPATPSSTFWYAAAKPGEQEAACTIASISSEGQIIITDSRNLSQPLKRARGKPCGLTSSELFLCVSWSPALKDTISISGFDGTVQIYNTTHWDMAMKERDSLFTHRGHAVMGMCVDGSVPRITAHSWHPWKERMVLSAATDGSLHAWDWSDSHRQQDS
ncbi:integrator complex assembly factor WDR73 [Pelodytes ibericus]